MAITSKIIKATIACFLFSAVSASFAAKPEDWAIILKVNAQGKKDIDKLTRGIKEIKPQDPDNPDKIRGYHATVGWIPNAKTGEKSAELKTWMNNVLKSIPAVTYVSAVGPNGEAMGASTPLIVSPKCLVPSKDNKNCTRYAIVLSPDEATKTELKRINQLLNDKLNEFNVAYRIKKPYVMYPDIVPAYFVPHITLADTGQVKKADRKAVIDQINKRIADQKFKMVKLNKY